MWYRLTCICISAPSIELYVSWSDNKSKVQIKQSKVHRKQTKVNKTKVKFKVKVNSTTVWAKLYRSKTWVIVLLKPQPILMLFILFSCKNVNKPINYHRRCFGNFICRRSLASLTSSCLWRRILIPQGLPESIRPTEGSVNMIINVLGDRSHQMNDKTLNGRMTIKFAVQNGSSKCCFDWLSLFYKRTFW